MAGITEKVRALVEEGIDDRDEITDRILARRNVASATCGRTAATATRRGGGGRG